MATIKVQVTIIKLPLDILSIIGIVVATAVVMTSITVTPVFAIKNYFNCMTDIVNEHGKLTLDDVHICLYKEYGVYNKVPYDVFIHSSSGAY